MIALVVSFVGSLVASSSTPGDGLQRAVELVRQGDFQGALAAGEADAEPLARAQARVYVHHHAGDLEGALRAAVEGARAHPHDPWLAERRAYVAASLRRVAAAEAGLASVDSVLRDASPAERERWTATLAPTREDVARTRAIHDAAETAGVRARLVAALGLVVGVGALVACAWPRRHKMSSTPVAPIGSNKVDGGNQ